MSAQSSAASRAEELAALPLDERLQRRIIDGERNGLEADLDEALQTQARRSQIINDTLLAGMKTVGELFGSGEMQLPFVLQSAEVMKTAVAYLEPHMEKADAAGKGTIVLATVKGDVHDIGKNLVDIILSNNGYTVVNIGIKQPITAILEAAEEHHADAIGMSGLLVKSTVIMKENLEEMNARGIAERCPVLLGGAALTRGYVEQDLVGLFEGDVRYARDAFEGLRLMDALMAIRRVTSRPTPDGPDDTRLSDEETRKLAERKARRERSLQDRRAAPAGRGDRTRRGACRRARTSRPTTRSRRRRSGATGSSRASRSPTTRRCSTSGPRSWASGGCAAHAVLARDRPTRSWSRPRAGPGCGTGWTVSRPRVLEAAVVYGYFPCVSKGDDLVVLDASRQPSGPGSPSRASAASAGCAWRTSSAPRTPATPTSSAFNWSPSASRSASSPTSCSRPTPTATTSRCTACRCS